MICIKKEDFSVIKEKSQLLDYSLGYPITLNDAGIYFGPECPYYLVSDSLLQNSADAALCLADMEIELVDIYLLPNYVMQ